MHRSSSTALPFEDEAPRGALRSSDEIDRPRTGSPTTGTTGRDVGVRLEVTPVATTPGGR